MYQFVPSSDQAPISLVFTGIAGLFVVVPPVGLEPTAKEL